MSVDGRPIVFSVAHSAASPGVVAGAAIEYAISLRASFAAVRSLAGEFPVALVDVGPFKQSEYDDLKVAQVNGLKPRLAIEIHCNATDKNPHASYSEVLHHRASQSGGVDAAACIARALEDGFKASNHHGWKSKGARANTVDKDRHLMFFLERVSYPSVLVEGLFLTNAEQAAWLSSDGGAEAYGLMVAAGVRRWLGGERA